MRNRHWIAFHIGLLFCSLPTLLSADETFFLPVPPPAAVAGLARSAPDITASSVLQHLAGLYTTPKTVAAFLHREFIFRRDQDLFGEVEHWQTPDEFVAHRAGDCEDYAIMARELLVRNGIEAYVFSLFGDHNYAHTVCIFVEKGRYNVINQDKIRYYRAPTLEALASQMYRAWTFGGITEPSGIRGRLVQEITNDHPVRTMASLDPAFTSFPH